MVDRNIIAVAVALALGIYGGAIGVQTYRLHAAQAELSEVRHALLVLSVERHILATNRNLPLKTVRQITLAGIECARLHGIDKRLLFATMHRESTFNPAALGSSNERGLMQITRTTAAELGLPWASAFDVTANICAGAAYLSQHVRDLGVVRGLLRYNGGGAPEYPSLVMAHYERLSKAITR